MLEVATICVQTGLNPAFHILDSPCQYVPKGLWPPRSPDLTPPDYFLWGYLKGRVYRNKPQTIDALKANITEEIQAVTADVLARTFQNMAPGSIQSGRKWRPLPAHVMMSHFLHNEVSPLQISLQYPH